MFWDEPDFLQHHLRAGHTYFCQTEQFLRQYGGERSRHPRQRYFRDD